MKTLPLTLLALLLLCSAAALPLHGAASTATNRIRGSELSSTNRVQTSNTILAIVFPYPHPYHSNGTMQISAEDLLESLKLFPGWPAAGATNALTNNYASPVEFRAGLTNNGALGVSGAVNGWAGFTAYDSGFASYDASDYVTVTAGSAALDTSLAPFFFKWRGVLIASWTTNISTIYSNLAVLGTNFSRQIKLTGGQAASSLVYLDANTNLAAATIGTGLSFAGGTLSATATAGSGTNNPVLTAGPTIALILNQTARGQFTTNASYTWSHTGASNQSSMLEFEFGNLATNTIYNTNAVGFYSVELGSNVTTLALPPSSKTILRMWLNRSNEWVATSVTAPYALTFSGSGATLTTNHTTKVVDVAISSSGGSSTFNETNITVSTTNEIVIDPAAFQIVRIKLLTNLNSVIYSNVSTMGRRSQVYWQQDSNGTRTVLNNRVSGGLIQTNANLQPTTNANALDLLELMPGFFSTNLLAWWPQDFQPRIGFTNSLASVAYNPAIDPTIVQWLDATNIVSGTNNIRFSPWPASVGNNGVAIAGREPLFLTNMVNGWPAVKFDNSGSDKYMTTASFGTIAQPFEVWITFAWNATGLFATAFDGLTGSNRVLFYSGGTTYGLNAGTALTGGAVSTNWHVARLVVNGASSSITIDNGTPITGNAGSSSFVGAFLGIDKDIAGGSRVSISSFIVRNAVGSDTAAVWDYHRTRYATW